MHDSVPARESVRILRSFAALDRFPMLVALALGAAAALAFKPVGLWPAMPLAFALLAELISRTVSLRRALLTGWCFGLGQFVIGLNWLPTSFTYQANMPAWLGWVALVLLSLYLAVYPALAAGLAWRFDKQRPLPLVLVLAAAWAITEWLRATMFTGFAWNPVGVTLVGTPWLTTSVFVGTYGLSMLVVLAGGAIWLASRNRWGNAAGLAALLGLLLTLPAPFVPEDCCLRTFDRASQDQRQPRITVGEEAPPPPGTAPPPRPSYIPDTATGAKPTEPPPPPALPPPNAAPPPKPMSEAQQRAYLLSHRVFDNVRIVQPNIGQEDKWRPGFSDEAARRLAGLSGRAQTDGPRLLLWPEAAVTEPLEDARTGEHQAFAEYERTRAAALLRGGDILLTGGIALESKDGRRVTSAANSVFMIDSSGKVIGRYDKAHLVPYGEYLPMRPLLSAIGLSRLAPGDVDFDAGPGPRTIATPGFGKVGFQICYEIIFSGQVVDRTNRPDFIFNPSNDAWFGRWGPPQHLAQAQLRAAEEGLPVLRSTPTGISAIVDARGRIVQFIPWRAAGSIDNMLPLAAAHPTLFSRFGNVIPLSIAFLLLIGAIALGHRHRYSRT